VDLGIDGIVYDGGVVTLYWLRYCGTRFPVRLGETVVGRSAYCTIVVSDPSVSRQHAALRNLGEQVMIEDLGSHNGTFINGERVQGSRQILPGDTILLGSAAIELIGTRELPGARAPTTGVMIPLLAPDDTSTATQTALATPEAIDTMIVRAMQRGRPADLVQLIRNAIATAASAGLDTDRADAARIAGAADLLASWFEDHSLDTWRDQVAHKLGLK
jgi:FHA domain-containing protein